ncbi:hypothetical protein GMD78_04605 [Ornithinibacillus sp. L9]|uniref:PD-(D/E)XK nuclease superfamily protein n=1 Tax=Ornithinibacillus caprae TaxID=2678566 RepID=A0A6N8FER0_9BACI|nr:PD-(D/E)XK nuclease family protein [Ornithinibacillus caprae]MUK87681.1 hypothetical protein [Ornithinibacillus caprae]
MSGLGCPNCGAELFEDFEERMEQTNDGGVMMDTYPAYVCADSCGFSIRIDSLPRVIAQQGEERLLLLYSNMQGRIMDVRDSVIWPPMHIDALLARGGWEDYVGNHDLEKLLAQARDSRSAYLEPPNLFTYATSELSQDAFLCWLMSWSEEAYSALDHQLHEVAIDFISEIFRLHDLSTPPIESIEIERQFNGLDILAVINNKYAILIEDKTFTKNHSNQLERYKKNVRAVYPKLKQLPIYFKIADQSNYRSVEEAGYIPFQRELMMRILKRGIDSGVKNAIFLDYYRHVERLENSYRSFKKKPVKEWGAMAWHGFYQEVQKELAGNWGYVPNYSGGFWGFWWKSRCLTEQRYYLQLEQEKLCVKVMVKEDENTREVRQEAVKEVLEQSNVYQLGLQKPARLGTGKTMTIAERKGYIQVDPHGIVDIERTIKELKRY